MQQGMESSTESISMDGLSIDSPSSTSSMTPEVKLSTSSGSGAITWPSSRLGSYSSKPHAPSKDARWDTVGRFQAEFGQLGLNDLWFIRRVGSGDIGSVYLVEIKGSEGCVFAAKVMDKEELASRFIESRANIEREILEMLDHPFLPALYATLESDRWLCLLTEFCPQLIQINTTQYGL